MVATNAVPRIDVTFFEHHFLGRLTRAGRNRSFPAMSFGNGACSTKQILTDAVGDIVCAGQELSISNCFQVICRLGLRLTLMATEVVNAARLKWDSR
jgi:hypothetical protein